MQTISVNQQAIGNWHSGKAVLMLDLDDVLNPSLMRHPHKTRLDGYHKQPFGPVKAWVCEEHGQRLQDLDVQIVWATTWVDHPELLAEYAEAIGLPTDLPRIETVSPSSPKSCGKLNGVRQWLAGNDAEDVPMVWIDDALADHDLSWAEDRTAPTLTLKPIPQHGLTATMYVQVHDFLDTL